MTTEKMKVEIWSDATCVYCYMAKRKFESALAQINYSDQIEMEWKSFELAPNLKVDKKQSMYEFLAQYNKASLDQVKAICNQLVHSAQAEGLTYNFDIAKPANSFLSHQLSHIAKHLNLQDKAKEVLFKAHFTDGEDIDDIPTLLKLANTIGLSSEEVRASLTSQEYASAVKHDIEEAHQLGITGVPYFRFNKKHSVSGVQTEEKYFKLLDQSYKEWQSNQQSNANNTEGKVCHLGEMCD